MTNTDVKSKLNGIFTALVTPMKGGNVDMPAFEAHLERQLAAGVHGVSPVATTGESATLDAKETDDLITATVKRVDGKAFVMVGAGANSTRATIEKGRRAADLGADGLLVVVPYYNRPTQAGIYEHFAAVAQSTKLPVMLYNVPGRTGTDMSVATCARLVKDVPNIVGIKEASGKAERIAELRIACGDNIAILTGDDNLCLPALAVGANGVYSVASNLIPEEMLKLYRLWAEGKPDAALAQYRRMYRLLDDLFIESNPVPVKAALASRGLMEAEVRAPLVLLSDASWQRLEQTLGQF